MKARAIELLERAKDIYDTFMNSTTAQHEVLLGRHEKEKVKQILKIFQEQLGENLLMVPLTKDPKLIPSNHVIYKCQM